MGELMSSELIGDWSEFDGIIGVTLVLTEHIGVAVITLGGLLSLALAWKATKTGDADFYTYYRRYLGRSIVLGLEILVASDIIRTVSSTPQLMEVLTLGLIVLIRSFLSFMLAQELNAHSSKEARHKDKVPLNPEPS